MAAEVGRLPGPLGPLLGEQAGDRTAELGAAPVALAVGAHQPEARRTRHRRRDGEVEGEEVIRPGRARCRGRRTRPRWRWHGRPGCRDRPAIVAAEQDAPWVGGGEVLLHGLGQPVLGDRLSAPGAGALDEQDLASVGAVPAIGSSSGGWQRAAESARSRARGKSDGQVVPSSEQAAAPGDRRRLGAGTGVELAEHVGTWTETVLVEMNSCLPISPLVRPSATRARISPSRGVSTPPRRPPRAAGPSPER